MRVLRVIVVAWLLTALGVTVGWQLGKLVSGPEITSVVLGTLTILLAIRILAARGWFDPERRRGGTIGGMCGFALAASFAHMFLDRPLVLLLSMLLVGIGVIAGAGPSAAR